MSTKNKLLAVLFLAEGNRKKVPYVLTIVGAIIISFVVPIYTLDSFLHPFEPIPLLSSVSMVLNGFC